MKQIKCFIASAFGYQDVDTMYDESIIPVLNEFKSTKGINIKPLRVDRITHNEKIDVKIIELIKECDFGIVDLTYARPSVYYEAGFIEGLNKSVIYLAKNDHFRPKLEDTNGNERIHFDLVTKNIISWTTPNITFNQKLNSRINLIIKPIVQSNHISLKEAESRKDFLALALSAKIMLIDKTIKNHIIKKGFKPVNGSYYYFDKVFKNKLVRICVASELSFVKNDIRIFCSNLKRVEIFPNPYFSFMIFCSLKAIPKSRKEEALNIYQEVSENIFQYENQRVIFIDSIDSILKLEKALISLELNSQI